MGMDKKDDKKERVSAYVVVTGIKGMPKLNIPKDAERELFLDFAHQDFQAEPKNKPTGQ